MDVIVLNDTVIESIVLLWRSTETAIAPWFNPKVGYCWKRKFVKD